MSTEWTDEAARRIVRYAFRVAPSPFLIEDVKAYFDHELGSPSDPRNWGGAAHKARAWGSLRRVGYAAATTSNRSPKVLWQYTGKGEPDGTDDDRSRL